MLFFSTKKSRLTFAFVSTVVTPVFTSGQVNGRGSYRGVNFGRCFAPLGGQFWTLNNSSDQQWLQALAAEYEVSLDGQLTPKQWQELKSRVDVVPLEMALVQTANESAWGTSRFALKGNNYFGQWCYEKGCGIVPEQRTAGATHEVRSFSDARESVDAYINNINTTRAYAEFRNLRQQSRNKGHALNAEKLALGLKSYSERGMDYVKTIQAMIRSNRELIASS